MQFSFPITLKPTCKATLEENAHEEFCCPIKNILKKAGVRIKKNKKACMIILLNVKEVLPKKNKDPQKMYETKVKQLNF